MTYLQLVNNVLARLRESSVATVTATEYSTLIGKLVNDSKRAVEDAWDWDVLSTTINVTTAGGTSNYTVTGSGYRHKKAEVNDTSNQAKLNNVPIQWILDQQQLSTVQQGSPVYYAWNGFDGTDSKVEFFPTPDGIYTVKFNMFVPQADLSADADILLVPSEAVVAGAYARALVERGEDGGLASSEAFGLYKGILADQIAIESSRFIENDCFVAC
jgi:hypothetical protein